MSDDVSASQKDSLITRMWLLHAPRLLKVLMPPNSLQSRLWARKGVRHLVKFGIVGCSGLLVNIGLFTILQRVVPHSKTPSVFYTISSISFLSGGVSNFFLNRGWVFQSDGHALREGIQFIAVSVMALMVNLLIAHMISPILGNGHRTVLLATFGAIIVNFFINKYWTFRGK